MDNAATFSLRRATPSKRATTGIRKVVLDARAAPNRPADFAINTLAIAVPSAPNASIDRKRPKRPLRAQQLRKSQRSRQNQGKPLRPPNYGYGAVLKLQGTRDAERKSVGNHRQQNESDPPRATPAIVHRRQCDQCRSEHAHDQPDGDTSRRKLFRDIGSHQRRKQWIGAVQHACDR